MKKGIVLGLFLGVLMTGLIFLFVFKKETINIKKEVIDEESVVTMVVEKATPSVVTIRTERDIGTGFVVSTDGLIVTNKHVVVDMGTKYKVIIGKEEIEVKNIYRDPLNDLAIIKIDKTGLNSLILGDSDKLKVGQLVIAIGTALGEFRSTVTTGVISGLGRGITAGEVGEAEKLTNVIQTDAAINPGNSGGPLFNSSGQVIGVNVAVSQSGQNIGFALPINLVKESIAYFRKTGEFERPYLGVGYKMMEKGAWVESVSKESPASKSDLKIGDIITEIDGEKLDFSDNGAVVKVINQKKIGQTIKLTILRDKKEMEIEMFLEKRQG